MREGKTEVLVVGAGPVGLWAALSLAEAGIEVSIIDREAHTAARSYACALHPHTLRLLDRFGLTEVLLEQGRRIQKVALYDHQSRRAEIDVSKTGGKFPFLLILPQNELESALEQRLRKAGVSVHWNHRFDNLTQEEESVTATVQELAGTGTGYIVPHWETVVKKSSPMHVEFLIGADGHNSLVRQRLDIEHQSVGATERFAAYEFETDTSGNEEIRVVLDEATTNVLWPLPGNKCRWTFQLIHSKGPKEFPEKERRAVHLDQPAVDERIQHYVEKIAKHRAAWFSGPVKNITWCTQIFFERRLAQEFGRSRCWLAGDAAHQTGPVGVQSMNVGFAEAEKLSTAIRKIMREDGSMGLLKTYNRDQQNEWRQLLGLTGGLASRSETNSWVKEHRDRILPCLPGSGEDLLKLAPQLSLDLIAMSDVVSGG